MPENYATSRTGIEERALGVFVHVDVAMLNGRILLKLNESKAKVGSLYVPEQAQDAPQTAVVVAVCSRWREGGEWILPVTRVGDKVIFGKYDGSEIELNGEKYLAIRESSLICISEPAPQSSEQPELSDEASQPQPV